MDMVTAHLSQHRGTTSASVHSHHKSATTTTTTTTSTAAQIQTTATTTITTAATTTTTTNTTATAKHSSSNNKGHRQNNHHQNQQCQITSNPDELDIKQFVPALSSVLCQITQRNDKMSLDSAQLTVFHALRSPSISVQAYLERLVKYAYCSSECFVLAIIYLDRIIQKNTSFLFTSLNVHRLLITGVMIAAKFFDDTYYNNAYYARVGGIPTAELNTLELKFLHMVDFSLHVTPDLFNRYKRELLMYSVPPPSPPLSVSQSPPHSPIASNSSPPPIPVSPKSPLNLSDMDASFRARFTPSPSSVMVPTAVTTTAVSHQEFIASNAANSLHPLAVAASVNASAFHQQPRHSTQSSQSVAQQQQQQQQQQHQQQQQQQAYVGLVHPYPQRVIHIPSTQPFPQYNQFMQHQMQHPQCHILQQPYHQQQIYLLHTAPVSPSCIVPAATTITQQHHPSRVAQLGSAFYGVPVYDF